jgi:hypothetical protein
MQSAARIGKVAKAAQRLATRRVGRHAIAHEIRCSHREMRLELGIHLIVHARPTSQAQIEQPAVETTHVAEPR